MFTSLEDLAARIDDPDLDVTPDDFLVLQNAGPLSRPGMPEAGYLPIPKKLARAGVKDMVRISDARMSGTAYGTIVLHVTPDAASGGPLAGAGPATASASRSRSAGSTSWSRRRTRPPPGAARRPRRGYARLYRNVSCRPTTAATSTSCANTRSRFDELVTLARPFTVRMRREHNHRSAAWATYRSNT